MVGGLGWSRALCSAQPPQPACLVCMALELCARSPSKQQQWWLGRYSLVWGSGAVLLRWLAPEGLQGPLASGLGAVGAGLAGGGALV